jgi:hypothetical protein
VNYNPYAAPQTPLAGPPTGSPYGQPLAWNTGEVISQAWAAFKIHGGVVVLSYLLSTVVTGALGQIPALVLVLGGVPATGNSAPRIVLQVVGMLIGQVSAAYFQGGLTRIWLAVARGETPVFATLFSGADRFLPILLLNFLMMPILALGLVFLIVPGIVLYLGLFASQFYVIDAGMNPIEAMKASWAATRGQKGEIFLLMLGGVGLCLVGLLMCCVGMLVTFPVYFLSTAIVFTRISGRVTIANRPGAGPEPFVTAPTA